MNKPSDSKFVIRKYNIVNDQSNSSYSVGNEIIYSTEVLKPNVCDYNDAYILVIGSTTIIRHNLEIIIQKIAHHLMRVSITKSNGTTLDDVEYLALVMPMYNFLEYSSDYSDMTGFIQKIKELILMSILLIIIVLNLSTIKLNYWEALNSMEWMTF